LTAGWWQLTPQTRVRIARETLTDDLLRVYIAKHASGYGRRSGSLMLGITEDAWRYRITKAEHLMNTAIRQWKEAA
jgi:uncharacterized membrane protein